MTDRWGSCYVLGITVVRYPEMTMELIILRFAPHIHFQNHEDLMESKFSRLAHARMGGG